MNINELENKLHNEGLMTIYQSGAKKNYINKNLMNEHGEWINTIDVFGIQRDNGSKYCFFFTDSERGIPNYVRVFDSEDEACVMLYDKVNVQIAPWALRELTEAL